jgi:hypothetical protein
MRPKTPETVTTLRVRRVTTAKKGKGGKQINIYFTIVFLSFFKSQSRGIITLYLPKIKKMLNKPFHFRLMQNRKSAKKCRLKKKAEFG